MKEERNYYESDGDILHNSSAIPNIVDEMGLSPEAVRLYIRFKRRVSQNADGTIDKRAFDTTMNLAKDCDMSPPTVTKAKRELEAAGLIRICFKPTKHGEYPRHDIKVVDLPVWAANKEYFSDKFVLSNEAGERIIFDKDPKKNAEMSRIHLKENCTKDARHSLIVGMISRLSAILQQSTHAKNHYGSDG